MTAKKTASRSPSSRSRRSTASPNRRVWRVFSAAAVLAFGAASYFLNPDLREYSLDGLVAHLSGESRPAGAAPQAPSYVPTAQGQIQTVFADCPQFFPNRQPPVVPAAGGLRELCFSAFAILHSGQSKTPVFVAQRLNRQMLAQAQSQARNDRFYADARLPQAERAELLDYKGSGYSRGHMAPAADMHTPEAMAQSFSLANMVPQDQRHNGGAWSRIEQDTRKYIERARGDVYVFTGPVYDGPSATIGKGKVAVPSHIYKVVYDPQAKRAWVHWQANDPGTQAGTPISYSEFERRTGMRLLPAGVQ